jgi:hypothetical protein
MLVFRFGIKAEINFDSASTVIGPTPMRSVGPGLTMVCLSLLARDTGRINPSLDQAEVGEGHSCRV